MNPAAATIPPADDTAPAPADAAAPPLVPGYEVIEQLGRGGMGVVYMARHVALNRTVALKMIRGSADADELRRFQNEAEASARLQHPNIVQVYEVGTADGRPYLSLEYVPGGSLDRVVADNPQTPPVSAATVEKLARAVHVAHAAGILHRDLKPANVLLAPPSDGSLPWVPKVADFGLAKRFQEDIGQTQTGAILGTPSYMAPEQASGGKDVGPAADVYALGAILYHMLTGRPPFKAASAWDTITQVLHDDPLPPSGFHPKLPPDLETVCLKCLHKVPERRYASAEALADDLGRFLRGEPVTARPVGAWERTVKWVRRRPAAAGMLLAAVVAVVSLVGGGVALYFNRELTESAALAESRRRDAEDQRELAEARKRAAEWSATDADKQRAAATDARADADKQRDLAERFQYIAQVGLAQRTFEEGNVPRALALLDRYRPAAGAPDRRQFEWHHLRRTTRNLLALHAHREDAQDVTFSADGKWLATAGWDNVARVWDARTGAELRALEFKQTAAWQRVTAAAFSRDAARVAVAFHQSASVFDATTGVQVFQLRGHTNTVSSVVFSPDGTKLATGSADGSARVWDAATGKELFVLSGDPKTMIRRVAFRPDGAALAGALAFLDDSGRKVIGGGVRVWDLTPRKESFARRWDGRGADDLTFDPTGTRLAIPQDASVRVIALPSGEEKWAADAHKGGAMTVAFSPDGKRVASGGYDLTVRVWDAADGKEQLALNGHAGRETLIRLRGVSGVNRVAFSPDGTRLASAADGGEVMVWDVAPPPNPFPAPLPKLTNTFVSPYRTRFAVWVPARGVMEVRPTADGKTVHELKGGPKARRAWFGDRDDRLVVEYGTDARDAVQVWDAASGKSLLTVTPAADDKLFLSGDGATLVAAGASLRLWDVATGREVESRGRHKFKIAVASFSPDGRYVATAAGSPPPDKADTPPDCDVKVWEVATGKLVCDLKEHTWLVRSIAWGANNAALATASQDARAMVWHPLEGRLVQRFLGLRTSLLAVAISPDGRRIATGGTDKVVRLWDVLTGEEVLALKGHTQPVAEVKFAADGRTLMSRAGADEWKAWDARPTDR